MKRVALITYAALPNLDALDAPLPAALQAEGLAVDVQRWDDPAAEWSRYDAAVFRSPWDYFQRPAEFAAWLDRASQQTRLFNPPEVIRWNLHKQYLLQLADRGVPTVPTEVLRKAASLAEVASARGWTDVVVKPAISAGAWRTARFTDVTAATAQQHLESLLRGGDVLVQPFQPEVLGSREYSVVYLDGAPRYAITKRAAFEQRRDATPEGTPVGTVRAEFSEAALTPEALTLAAAAMEVASPEPLLYGRVDMVRGPSGALQVMELELFDPSLYLSAFPGAAETLAKGIARRITS